MKKTLLILAALSAVVWAGTASAVPNTPLQDTNPYAADQPKRVEFLHQLQVAVAAGDRRAVADLVSYPMSWNHGKIKGSIRSRAALLKSYDRIFNQKVKDAIAAQKPADLFVRDQGTMIGGGEVWFEQVNGSKRFRIITVNN